MKLPHKHATQIKAWADGHEIEVKLRGSDQWTSTADPAWHHYMEYRVRVDTSLLIAAAQDLLDALQGLMYKDCGEPAFVAARAAINKATGVKNANQ